MIARNEFWLQLHELAAAYEGEGLTTEDRANAILNQLRNMRPVVQRSLLEELLSVAVNAADLYARAAAEVTEAVPGEELLLAWLDEAIAITEADMGNVQLVDEEGALRIAAQRGFAPPFLEFFHCVKGEESACGQAMLRGERTIVTDVVTSPIFAGTKALEIMLAAGARACQSTPLLGPSGRVMGVMSTHFKRRHRPTDFALRRLDLLARSAAMSLELAPAPTPGCCSR